MVEAVIFDIDGTLIDTVDLHAEAWRETFREYGHDFAFADIRSQIGKGGDQLMPFFLGKAVLEEQGAAIEHARGKRFKSHFMPLVRPFPKVRELFERLRADGIRIVLGSSAKGDELQTYVDLLQVGDLIESSTTSDDVERSKPHPDIFLEAVQSIGNPDSAHVLVVGDTPYDAIAANRAGLRTVGVLCGGFPETELLEAGCIALYQDPADILRNYDDSPFSGQAAG